MTVLVHMKVHYARFARFAITALLLLACSVANTAAQTRKQQLTLDWIFGPEGRTVASVPATAWLDDGTLVVLDNRRPPAEQTFVKLTRPCNAFLYKAAFWPGKDLLVEDH